MELAGTPSPTSGLVPRNSKQQVASRAGCSPRAAESRLDVELPILQSEHEMRMMAMQMMTSSISEAMERYKELIQVNSSYRIRHSQLLREQTQLKNNIQILLNEKSELLVEQTERPASCVEAKRLCEEAGMNICVPSEKEQQV
ncbi:uncharacterized protein LOC134480532 isoform X2 [Rattus norvegicus]|uniref:uncharacterized protein LOC134480532 isoform X2 n=1 Tax=Rattus norvegicus TaxID=10116 RepID=UPI002FD7E61C